MEIELETIHLAVLLLTGVVILIADHDGLTYLLGKREVLPIARVQRLHRFVWFGLIGMLLSGLFLILDEPNKLDEPVFYVKMLMVCALVANAFWIGKLSHVATEQPFASLTLSERHNFLLSGAISTTCWFGAAFIGLFLL